MFYNKLFREEAVARRARPEPLDERLQVTAPHEWMVLAGLGLSLLVFLVWGVFGSVERRLSVKAVLVPAGRAPCRGLPRVRQRRREAGRRRRHPRSWAGDRQGPSAGGGAPGPDHAEDRRCRRGRDAARRRRRRHRTPGVAARGGAERACRGRDPCRGNQSLLRMEGSSWRTAWFRGQPVHAGETVAQLRGRSEGAWLALAFVSPKDAGKITTGMAAEVLVALPGQPGSSTLNARVLAVSPRPSAAPEWLADFGLSTPAPFAPASPGAGRSVAPAAHRRYGRARADRVGEAVPRRVAAGGRGRLTPAAVSIGVQRATRSSVLPLPLGTERVSPEPRRWTDRTASARKS